MDSGPLIKGKMILIQVAVSWPISKREELK